MAGNLSRSCVAMTGVDCALCFIPVVISIICISQFIR